MISSLISRIWLWCHIQGVYNGMEGLPGQSDYTPVEALEYMGIRNALMVVYGGRPTPPFGSIQEKFRRLDNVVWSIIGDASSTRNQEQTDVEEVIALSRKYANVRGGIMDDFLQIGANSARLEAISARMHDAGLPLWVVLYAHELAVAAPHDMARTLSYCDVLTFWTWCARDLVNLDANLARVRELAPGMRLVLGCYLWDFGVNAPIPPNLMDFQLERARQWLVDGTIHDVILLGSPLFGMDLPSIGQARAWLERHGNTPCLEKSY